MKVNPYEPSRLTVDTKLLRSPIWTVLCPTGIFGFVSCEIANRFIPDPDNFPHDIADTLYTAQFGLAFIWLLSIIAGFTGVASWYLHRGHNGVAE